MAITATFFLTGSIYLNFVSLWVMPDYEAEKLSGVYYVLSIPAGLTFVFWSPSAKDASASCWSQVRGETEPRQWWAGAASLAPHLTTAPSPSLSTPLSRTVNED